MRMPESAGTKCRLPRMSNEEAMRAKASLRFVTPEFFKTLSLFPCWRGANRRATRIPMPLCLSSRSCNESFVRPHPGQGQDPIGRHLEIASSDRMVVGVVADISVRGLERPSEPQIYLSSQQVPDGALPWYAPKDLVIRAEENPVALAPALRAHHSRSRLGTIHRGCPAAGEYYRGRNRNAPGAVARPRGDSRSLRSCWPRSAFMACCRSRYRRARRRWVCALLSAQHGATFWGCSCARGSRWVWRESRLPRPSPILPRAV